MSASFKVVKRIQRPPYADAFFGRHPDFVQYSSLPPLVLKKIKEETLKILESILGIVDQNKTILSYLYDNEITRYTPSLFGKMNGFTWTESMVLAWDNRYAAYSFLCKYINDNGSYDCVSHFIEERLHQPIEGLEVVNMGESGKGVFLSMDSKPLPIGTFIGLYTGKIRSALPEVRAKEPDYDQNSDQKPDYYKYRVIPEVSKNTFTKLIYPEAYITAEEFGNIFRFLQDLPEPKELEMVDNISQIHKDKIATQNVHPFNGTCYGFPIIYLVTTREIQPGEQLGYRYGWSWEYWDGRRRVFDKSGTTIGTFSDETTIEFSANNINELENAARENSETARLILDGLNVEFDTFSFQKRFRENVNYTFKFFTQQIDETHPIAKYILNLKKQFNEAAKSDDKYIALSVGLKNEDPTLKANLPLFRKELIFHMKKYNEGKTAHIKKNNDNAPGKASIQK